MTSEENIDNITVNDDINNNIDDDNIDSESDHQSHPENEKNNNTGNIARLMIKKIKLHNFKSYAGIKEIGPFHHRFSAIVGPNGSGKSNLIDALLFVFGYRTKKLRLNKLSELIHNSNHGTNLPFASVEILFQQVIDTDLEKEEYDVVPDSEISLKRVATKDNKSTYYLNDKKSTWSDIRNVLKGFHIDLANNRFLILQGEVELISQMKPKAPTQHEDGLLEYIEDIIGSNRLIEEIDKAVDDLEKYNTDRAQQLNRVKAIENARDSLEGAKNEAQQFLELEGEIYDNQGILYQLQSISNQIKIDKVNEDKQPVEDKLTELRDSMKEKTNNLTTLEKDYEQKRKDHTKIAKELEETKKEFFKFERKREKLKQDRSHHKKRALTIGKQIKKDEKKKSDLIRTKETSETELVTTKEKIAELLAEQEKKELELEEIQSSIQDETASLREAVEVEKTKLMPKKKIVTDLKAKIDLAKSELTLLEEKGNAGKKQLEEAIEALEHASNRAKEATQQINELQTKNTDATSRLPNIQKSLNDAKNEELQLTRNIRELEAKYEHSLQQQQENTSRNKVLNACLHLRDQQGLGVLGRLGNLGAIDDKYDIAISTACRELDSIVVKSFNDAKQCINHMKQHNLGRARFISLEDQQHLVAHMYKKRGNTPEGAPRLFDLIKTKDESILPVFYFALRDTLVAKDLQQAKRLAYGKTRYRVVTLQGNIIDLAGTVSGGGNTVSKGGMKSTLSEGGLSKQEMNELRETLEKLRSKLNALRKRIYELNNEQEQLSIIVNNAEVQLTKLKMEQAANKKHEKELQHQIPELKKNSSNTSNMEDLNRIKELQEEITNLENSLNEAIKATSQYEKKIQSLQAQIMDKGGLPLKVKQTEVDDIISLIDDTNKAMARHQVKIKSHSKKIITIEKDIETQQKDLEKELELHETKKKELSELTEQGKLVIEKYNNAQTVLDTTEVELEESKQKYEELKTFVSKFKTSELDLLNQLDTYTQTLEQLENAKKSCSNHLSDLELKKKSLFEIDPELASPLKLLDVQDIENTDPKAIKKLLTKLEDKLKSMNPNMGAIGEYRSKDKEYKQKALELDELTTLRDNQQKHCEELRKKRLDEFMSGFAIINRKLKEMYRMITLEGDAELEFVDSIDPFSEGIVFSVRPPKKSWKNIANLSGGEKTLSSLALVFALHHYKPTPLYFMDEIDAALDFKNVSIVAHYIKERTKNAQFIIISLRNNMFELADHLIGIYKPDNCTQSVTISPNNYTIGNNNTNEKTME